MKMTIWKSLLLKNRVISFLLISLTVFNSACTSPSAGAAQYRPTVTFSGIAYLGNYALIEQNYPYALMINHVAQAGTAVGALDQRFTRMIRQSQPKHFDLQLGLADLRKGQSIAMALAFERESVSTEVIGESRKIIVEAAAQVFFFDFASMTLIANFPLSIAKNHVLPKEQDYQQQLPQLFNELYLGVDGNESLLELARGVIENASVDLTKSIRFQLEEVASSEKVQSFLPPELTVQQLNQFMGQYFSARLANQYRIAVLPFTKGYAIGNQMSGRFANGEVFNLNLPPPDYVFTMHLADLKKAPFKDNLMYACRLELGFAQKVSGKEYFNDVFQYAVGKLVTTTMTEIDDWSAYQDALEMLIDDLVLQLGKPDKTWFKSHAKDQQVYQKFKTKQSLFVSL